MSDPVIWQPIHTAPKSFGVEFLGCMWAKEFMVKEPFITFWSPTLQKFYGSPTHWVPLPLEPEP